MIARLLNPLRSNSFFLFGPRGTGKTHWVRRAFPQAVYLDLLDTRTYAMLLSDSGRLEELIPPGIEWVVIDEVQRVPDLLNEVHRLIEHKQMKFVLTGSSARTLRRRGVNLLAGRALTYHMHPLTAVELGADFDLIRALQWGHLPTVLTMPSPEKYLETYVGAYLREEVLQEGLTRDLGAFSNFLEIASLSQGQILNVSGVARESLISRKTAEGYFSLTEDLLIAHRLPIFTKRAKHRITAHPKFYFFDVGIFRALRPHGPGDLPAEIDGAAIETLVFQELRAINDLFNLQYKLHYWRTRGGSEVDFVLYGPKGFHAIEVKRTKTISPPNLRGLREFGKHYPDARLSVFYGGSHETYHKGITCIPMAKALLELPQLLGHV